MNEIKPTDVPHRHSYFYKTEVVYLAPDGTETTDPTKAKLDRYGTPYLLRRQASNLPLDICVSAPPASTLNPDDPISRAAVLASLDDGSSRASFPQIYMDKFRAVQYASNSVNAFQNATSALANTDVSPSNDVDS